MSVPARLLAEDASNADPVPASRTDAPPSHARRPGLDVVRAAAILLVMLHHLRHLPGAPGWFQWFALRGYIGVDLFFVLSGWLIGGQLVREVRRTGTVEVRRFWSKRWFRTLPAYYVVLAVLLVRGAVPLSGAPPMLVFLQNYLSPGTWLATWSLCIEEHFYLVLPLVVLALVRLRSRPGIAVVLGCVALVVSPALRWAGFAEMARGSYESFLASFYSPTHLRLDGLVVGVLLAAAKELVPQAWNRLTARAGVLAITGVAVVAAAAWLPWLTGAGSQGVERMQFFNAVPGFFLVSLGVGLVIPWAAKAPIRAAWLAAPSLFVAEHAYALYLTHEEAIRLVKPLARYGLPFWPALFVAAAGSCVFAVLLRRFVEKPGLALRERFVDAHRAERRHVAVVLPDVR